MSSRSLPYYRWYVTDFRASRAAQRLSYLERGLYRDLLDECWVEGHIPDDPAKLADICGCPLGVMAEAWPNLRPRFSPIEGLDGMYLTSARLEVERTELDAFRVRQSMRRKGKADPRLSAVIRGQPAVAVVKHEQSSSSAAPPLAPEGAACLLCGGRGGVHRPDCLAGGGV